MSEPIKSALERANYYRSSAGLPPIEADKKLCEGDRLHSTYLVKNHLQGGTMALEANTVRAAVSPPGFQEESPGNRWYTEAGANAARHADVIRGAALPADGTRFIDQMASTPFSALLLLNPQLSAVGYGGYCEGDDCAATLTMKQGLSKSWFVALYESASEAGWNPALGTLPFTRARLRKPVEFPPDHESVPYAEYDGGGAPDPRTACPGYALPMGPPIILELGESAAGGAEVVLGSYSIAEDGVPVESCGFDATTYAAPNGFYQQIGRYDLSALGAVIVMPRKPLKPGHIYTVAISADSTEYHWSFRIASNPRLPR